MEALYTAEVTATGGRGGRAKSADGTLDLALAVPKGLGGPGGEGTNPEQLFAAGYAACFGGALGVVTRMQKVQSGPPQVTARVSIGKQGEGFGLAVELRVHLPGVALEQAEALVAAAHQICPYSNATRNNIDVKLVVELATSHPGE